MLTKSNKSAKRARPEVEKQTDALDSTQDNLKHPKNTHEPQNTLTLILEELNKLNSEQSNYILAITDLASSSKDNGSGLPKPAEAGFAMLPFELETEEQALLNDRLRHVTYCSILYLRDSKRKLPRDLYQSRPVSQAKMKMDALLAEEDAGLHAGVWL